MSLFGIIGFPNTDQTESEQQNHYCSSGSLQRIITKTENKFDKTPEILFDFEPFLHFYLQRQILPEIFLLNCRRLDIKKVF